MRIIAFIIGLGLCTPGFTQFIGGYADAGNLSDVLRAAPSELHKKTGEAYGTIGTPNVYEEFKRGNVYFSNKTVARNLSLNYDCYNDRVLYNKGDVDYILNSRMIDYLEFHIGKDSSVIFKQVFVKEMKKTIFMKLLYRKESILYMHYYKSFQPADYTGAYNQDKRYDEYIDNYAWYLELKGKDPVRLRSRNKFFIQLMEPVGKEIGQFLKEQKPDLKSEEGLLRLISYYDDLIAGLPE